MSIICKLFLFPIAIIMKWLAERDTIFTTCQEGTAKAIMRGGSFDYAIMSFAGYHLNDPRKSQYKKSYRKIKIEKEVVSIETISIPDWEVVYHGKRNTKEFGYDISNDGGNIEKRDKDVKQKEREESDDCYDDRSWILKELGLYWVGWPWINSVYEYVFEWNELSMNEEGEEKISSRKERTRFIYVADFTYAIRTTGAETSDLLPVDLLTLVTVAVRNPYRAMFSGEDWMQRITAAINLHVRTFVGNRNYDELIDPLRQKKNGDKQGDECGKDLGVTKSEVVTPEKTKLEEIAKERQEKLETKWYEFSNPIIALNDRLSGDKPETKPSGLKGRYGIKVRTADLQTADLSGEGSKQNKEASIIKYIAKQKADAVRIEGQASADVIEMIGEKEASSLSKRLDTIKKYEESGLILAQLDAIENASKGQGNTVVWANNPFLQIPEILKQKKGGEK